MRTRWLHRTARGLMVLALLLAGIPLLRPWWPGALPARPPSPGDLPPEPGRVVVDARDTVTPGELAAAERRLGVRFRPNSPGGTSGRLLVADVAPGQEAALIARLRKERWVESAEPMYRFRAYFTPNDPEFRKQWNMRLIGAEKAWDRTAGKGVIVAVIDTGVAFEEDERCYRARDFVGTRFARGYDFVHDDEHPNDDNGHGTHVAGTISETTNNGEGAAGLAYEATVMPLKVLDESGTGSSADIADAIRFAVDHGARVLNLSLGGPFPADVTRQACRYAREKGAVIVCAAGNAGGGPVGYPAAFPECIAVSAVGPTGERAPYSSAGPEVALAGPGGDKREGDAGGVLQNTVQFDDEGRRTDGYFAFQGTSMASPHVAAAAALAVSRGVTDGEQVRQVLLRAAQPRGPEREYGAGVLDAARTVELADGARRDSGLLLLFSLGAGVTGLGFGAVRARIGGLAAIPFAPFGLGLGLLGPDLAPLWVGFGTPFALVFHSALIPLYLLWEADSRPVYRFVAAAGLGMTLHLGWEAAAGGVVFPGVLPSHGLPWLWVNTLIALAVALVAFRRGESRGA